MIRDSEMLAPIEAASLLGCHRKTVTRMMDAGKLDGVRSPLGRLVTVSGVLAERERRKAPARARN